MVLCQTRALAGDPAARVIKRGLNDDINCSHSMKKPVPSGGHKKGTRQTDDCNALSIEVACIFALRSHSDRQTDGRQINSTCQANDRTTHGMSIEHIDVRGICAGDDPYSAANKLVCAKVQPLTVRS